MSLRARSRLIDVVASVKRGHFVRLEVLSYPTPVSRILHSSVAVASHLIHHG